MTAKHFFEESREQSEVKAAIVAKYFWAWAKVIMPTAKKHSGKIAYIDLFAGPGRYGDDTKSTPLLILQQAIADPVLSQMLVTMFNDVEPDFSQSLEREIASIDGIEKLKYPPQVYNFEVGNRLVEQFEQMKLVPTLFFVDPWGYKGLSLRLINSVLKDWGCDCLFFFNYNRISMGIRNAVVKEHMDALFGEERANELRGQLEGLSPEHRELAIIEAIAESLEEYGGKYVLPFRFRRSDGKRTSHHLIFVSKNIRGYAIMKDIMAGKSTTADQGVPSFEYNPSFRNQGLLFELSRPLDDLEAMLLDDFAGRTLTRNQIFEAHHVGKPFIEKNYRQALLNLEQEGRIAADPPADKRKKHTLAKHVKVTFPEK